MKVLVTGATGFIGYHVIHELLKRDVQIIASATSSSKAVLSDWFHNVKFIPHSITVDNNENLFNKFEYPDLLIHLAWQGLPNYRQSFHLEKVLPAQYKFISNLVTGGLKNITITGTCFEYGMQEGKLSEDMPAKPDNPYAIAKNTLREDLEMFAKTNPFNFKWVRLFYMYGKGQNPASILPLLDKALETGEKVFNMSMGDQLRDYLPVEKVAENIVNIALQDKVTGIINCCSGTPISVKTLVENHLTRKQKNIELNLGYYPYPDYEPRNFWGDADKLLHINQ